MILESRVLKLNRNYNPIGVCTARDAFELIYSNRAEVVNVDNGSYTTYDFTSWAEISELKHELEEYGELDEFIFTTHLTLEIPRVIRTVEFGMIPHHKVKLNRRNIYSRDKNVCQYCGKSFKPISLTIDHVMPKSRGGRNTWTNLVCACVDCNRKKGPKTPEEAHIKLIRKPVEPLFVETMDIGLDHAKYSVWEHFISDSYWNVALID